MKLDRVTITGADDQARVDDLIALSKEFPFVEWGILLASDDRSGSPRYPSREAITNFAYWSSEAGMQLSLHLCGTHTREIFLGYSTFAEINPVSFAVFRRIQVNYRSVPENTSIPSLIAFLRRHSRNDSLGRKRQFIFQFRDDGDLINRIHADGEGLDVVALFDASGGRGELPSEWPAPVYIDAVPDDNGNDFQFPAYHGYAGGLGPDNLEEQLPKIAATGCDRVWIDMETRVRTDDGKMLDLAKVRRCLEISKAFIETASTITA